ncbi:glycosylphosphatidylinositol anchor attachment 1 protein [Galendromus occidentalis]|uniref:Glycosylphosphatidylinositol anchor attachment 1 protein n=1 Tax=Galendromus occidentalis TaxID=34638 RepID=A0AAJ6QVR5_9ACAR|nr:glycosylphosphatidylinositol anchor attachment 1 protein [Galendromus occidentalis]
MGSSMTPSAQRHFLLSAVLKYNSVLCCFLYPLGIAAFICLGSPEVNDQTYFSDNSLLPGMVERSTRIAQEAESILGTLESEVKSHSSIPYAWLAGQFRQAGLEVYRHNFTLAYPIGSRQLHHGENLFAIMRAPRASRTEAIVISAPFRAATSPHASNLASIATMIALARQFRKKIYWSKDIIFVVTEHELVGLQAWLDAYHMVETSPGVLLPGSLDARSGNILAAINLELQDKHVDQVNVKIFGLNGQLPNLDLVNTCKNLMQREAVPYILEDRADPVAAENRSLEWEGGVMNLFSQMTKQATGAPSAAHGLYHRFAIQALTLQGQPKVRGYSYVTLTNIGRVIEGLVRSVNNLLQRFHRSFFYYYLPSMDRYISIAYYMGAFGILISPVALKSIALLLELHDQQPTAYMTLLWKASPLVLLVQLLGAAVFASPVQGESMVKSVLSFSTRDALYAFMIGASANLLVLPIGTKRAIDPQPQRLLMLLHYLLVIGPLAMLNISLAVLVAVLTVPAVLTAGVNTYLPLRLLQRIVQILVNPFVLTYIVLFCHSVALDRWDVSDPKIHLVQAFNAHKKLLLFTVEDWYIYGAANFPILCLGFLPVWAHMWSL